jgi:hypothetical protein
MQYLLFVTAVVATLLGMLVMLKSLRPQ